MYFNLIEKSKILYICAYITISKFVYQKNKNKKLFQSFSINLIPKNKKFCNNPYIVQVVFK